MLPSRRMRRKLQIPTQIVIAVIANCRRIRRSSCKPSWIVSTRSTRSSNNSSRTSRTIRSYEEKGDRERRSRLVELGRLHAAAGYEFVMQTLQNTFMVFKNAFE